MFPIAALDLKAGIVNQDCKAQRALLADVDAGKVSADALLPHGDDLLKERAKGVPAGEAVAH